MRKLKASWKHALILSTILHLGLGAFLHFSEYKSPNLNPKNITIEIVDAKNLPPQLEPARKPEKEISRTIVQQDANIANNKEDPKAKFLSEKTQSVEKETIARSSGDFRNTENKQNLARVMPTPPRPNQKPSSQISKSDKPLSSSNLKQELFKSFDPTAAMDRKLAHEDTSAPNQAPANTGSESDPSQTNDYAKNIQKGDQTLLNTKEFKYYTYYNRIRRQLVQYWQPAVREKVTNMFRQGRTIASDQDRVTKLVIILNEAGTLVKIQVISDSGIRDLDEAAIEAFRAAAPFPNPPKGIIEEDGTVRIRWDLILES